MKKSTRKTKATQHARTAVLTQQDLANVIGGNNGVIVVENVMAHLQGIQGSGRT
jgi:hypothetical protein